MYTLNLWNIFIRHLSGKLLLLYGQFCLFTLWDFMVLYALWGRNSFNVDNGANFLRPDLQIDRHIIYANSCWGGLWKFYSKIWKSREHIDIHVTLSNKANSVDSEDTCTHFAGNLSVQLRDMLFKCASPNVELKCRIERLMFHRQLWISTELGMIVLLIQKIKINPI